MKLSKQTEANRKNAIKSTGPKTKAGKAKSSLNAIKHGLTAEKIVIAGENPDGYELLLQRLMDEHDPQAVIERELVQFIASDIWRLRRIPVFEAAILEAYQTFNELLDGFSSMKYLSAETDVKVESVIDFYKKNRDSDKFSEAQRAFLEAHITQKGMIESFDAPALKLGRSLVIQGNGLESLGKLSRYEGDLIRTLERHIYLLEKEQQKRSSTIDLSCEELSV